MMGGGVAIGRLLGMDVLNYIFMAGRGEINEGTERAIFEMDGFWGFPLFAHGVLQFFDPGHSFALLISLL